MRPSEAPDLLPGTLYMLVLRTLSAGPLHGYAIARRIKDASANALLIEDGSLYPALHRMENNRKARFYRLTAAGRRQLEVEAKAFDQMVRSIQLVMRTA